MISFFESFIAAVIAANQELYTLLLDEKKHIFYQSGTVGAGGDISIGMDLIAEEIFIKHLRSFGRIDSEESGIIGDGDYTIIIDPLDGSTNFQSHFPYYGSSVALTFEGETHVGIVTNLADNTLFLKTADRFQYTKLTEIKFFDVVKNRYTSVGVFERAYCSKKYAKKLQKSAYKYRSPGATALSLAYTHQLQFFIYEGALRSYDIKAGEFMCEGLYQHKEKDLTLICNELNHFENLKKILL
ncbi:MAG: inositol monophosphatase [Epsilonproteobacteria bacterium]|nr:inositol monophosphatase [Campylobacterota bacterium]